MPTTAWTEGNLGWAGSRTNWTYPAAGASVLSNVSLPLLYVSLSPTIVFLFLCFPLLFCFFFSL